MESFTRHTCHLTDNISKCSCSYLQLEKMPGKKSNICIPNCNWWSSLHFVFEIVLSCLVYCANILNVLSQETVVSLNCNLEGISFLKVCSWKYVEGTVQIYANNEINSVQNAINISYSCIRDFYLFAKPWKQWERWPVVIKIDFLLMSDSLLPWKMHGHWMRCGLLLHDPLLRTGKLAHLKKLMQLP